MDYLGLSIGFFCLGINELRMKNGFLMWILGKYSGLESQQFSSFVIPLIPENLTFVLNEHIHACRRYIEASSLGLSAIV